MRTLRYFLSCVILLILVTSRPAYTQNETTLPFLLLPSFDPSSDIHKGSSSPYSDDMPDLWKKTKGGFAGGLGEILVTLPLFNQLDREVAKQEFYIINWPLETGQSQPTVSGEVDSNGEMPSQTVNSGNHAGTGHIESDDNEESPDEDQVEHTHRSSGRPCFAADCNGGPCRCWECSGGGSYIEFVAVSFEQPADQATDVQVIQRPKVESESIHKGKNTAFIVANRELTGRLHQRDRIEIMRNRLEGAAPVTIQSSLEQRKAPVDVDLLSSGELVLINYDAGSHPFWGRVTGTWLKVWPYHCLDIDCSARHTLRLQPVESYEKVRPDYDGFIGKKVRSYLLSNGKIVCGINHDYVTLFKNRKGFWQSESSNRPLEFLITFRNYIKDRSIKHKNPFRYLISIPSQIFDLVSTWGTSYILSTFETMDIYSFIGSKNQLVVFGILNGDLYRYELVDNKWLKSKKCNVTGCKAIKLILLEDDTGLMFYKESAFTTYIAWTERDNQFEETAPYSNNLLVLNSGALISWNQRESTPPVFIWERIAGIWRKRILPTSSDATFNILALRDGRLLGIENGFTIKVFTDLDGQWQSMILYQSNSLIKGIKQLDNGYIAAWCLDGSILIWDLYQR